eukprot:TRINITY_DN1210_c0_g1_i1.p1 TRINITY_DN1210_c0_g1~~TRINITY_DN1210_c0_g1_i1.p1  ORF type:complete len:437 (-),score=22.00 TRINITY_DN1210_c0_g1_i1:169-1479(-)
MSGSIINICIGQAGTRIGSSFWSQLCAEHSISSVGEVSPNAIGYPTTFFKGTAKGGYVPRTIFIDLEPGPTDDLRSQATGRLFDPGCFIAGTTGSHNNWAEAKYNYGSELIHIIEDYIRKQVEMCDRLQGFQAIHSISGGTGSGLTALVLNNLSMEYSKVVTSCLSLFPSEKTPGSVVEPYNTVHAISQLIEISTCVMMVDNRSLERVCEHEAQIPTIDTVNKVAGRTAASIFATNRFRSYPHVGLRKMMTNIIPFPRMHFLVPFSVHLSSGKVHVEKLTKGFGNAENALFSHNPAMGKVLTAAGIYRGDFSDGNVGEELTKLHERSKGNFARWIDCPVMYSVCKEVAPKENSSAEFITNTTAIEGRLNEIHKNYASMVKRHAFEHWFTGVGLDSEELSEIEANVRDLITEYSNYQDAGVITDSSLNSEEDEDVLQ